MDKVKAQATQVAQKAQESAKAGQAKLGETQARRKADGLLLELGRAVYRQRTGRDGGGEADIDRLVREVQALEAEHGISVGSPAPADPGGEAGVTTPEGGFKLD